MTYLIDTHVLLWYMDGDTRLSPKYIEKIEGKINTILISKASLWEIAIKVSTGKLKLTMPLLEMENYLEKRSIRQLNFNFRDLHVLSQLPFYHNDPFDRLIISQALSNDLTIISDDKKFKLYPVLLLS
jgi:PIN domain nuclease of toxin-antitoxin system